MRLIDADALLAAYDREHVGPPGRARKLIEEAPDALVRCRDCKYLEHLQWLDDENGRAVICRKHTFTGLRSDDWFCADGERRTDDA